MAHRRSGFVRSQRRETSWLDIPPASATLVTSGGTILLTLTTAEKARRSFTIVRTHLSVSMESDQAAASEVQVGAVGMCVVSDQAEAIGVTAVPTPVTDAASDLFFLHQYLMNSFLFASGVGFQDNVGRFMSIDSKAMRKVNDDQDVIVVVELATGESVGQNWIVAGRLLIKEH